MPEIRNPNLQQGPGGASSGGSGGDMRGMIVFMLLALLALSAYEYFRPKQTEPPPPQQQAQSSPAAPSSEGPTGLAGSTNQPGSQASAPASPSAQQLPQIGAAAETETTIENEWYRITFTNRGGQVKHWILKHYYDTGGAEHGRNLDLVQQQAADHVAHLQDGPHVGYPLALYTYEPALTTQINQALYQVAPSGSATSNGIYLAPSSLTFHYQQNGIDVVKTFHFDSSYVVAAETQVKRNGQPVRALVAWPAALGDMEEFLPKEDPASKTRSPVPTSASSQLTWSADGKQNSEGAVGGGFLFWQQPGASNNNTVTEPFQYAALSDLYFSAAFLPDDPARATMVTLHNSIEIPIKLDDPNSDKRPAHLLGLAMGDSSGYTKLRIYAGPKSMDTLTSIHTMSNDGQQSTQTLQPLIQFGWLTVIAKPLYLALRFLYEHGVPNWGWAIILVTIVFNIALLPQRLMMMKQSVKMARIQPKIDVIKRKFAGLKPTDPKRADMNTEMMALYKQENINMYGSCLPLLLQMPLFFAYYRVLANVIELRQAHWFWLKDLSVPDPLYILPGIMLISMFLTQYMTPSPGMDPAQRKMMAFMMPVIFGFSMSHFASGLALYWCTGNIINMSMQLAINNSKMGKEMHEIAARRAAKKSGGGSSGSKGKK